jgi:hypothetical protein
LPRLASEDVDIHAERSRRARFATLVRDGIAWDGDVRTCEALGVGHARRCRIGVVIPGIGSTGLGGRVATGAILPGNTGFAARWTAGGASFGLSPPRGAFSFVDAIRSVDGDAVLVLAAGLAQLIFDGTA